MRRRAPEIPGLKKASSFLSEHCGVLMNQRIQRPESWKSQEVPATWSAGARGENTRRQVLPSACICVRRLGKWRK